MQAQKKIIEFKNIVRGGYQLRQARHKVFSKMISSGAQVSDSLNPFLRKQLFELRRDDWVALAFDSKDWKTLQYLRDHNSDFLDEQFVELLISYISANIPNIEKMYSLSSVISSKLLDYKMDEIFNEIDGFEPENTQSLFIFRTVCALSAHSSDEVKSYLEKNFKTNWLRKRFLYPFMYHAINSPSEHILDSFLTYVTTGAENDAEKAAIRFLLRDDALTTEPVSFKCYVALLCHPFDACEMLLNHMEMEFAEHGDISPLLRKAFDRLSVVLNISRVQQLSSLFNKSPFEFVAQPSCDILKSTYGFSEESKNILNKILNCTAYVKEEPATNRTLLTLLNAMRSMPYPKTNDWEDVLYAAQRWRFTDAGRLLIAISKSMYLLARRNTISEVREVLRLISFLGEGCTFSYTSPSGRLAYSKKFLNIVPHIDPISEVQKSLLESNQYKDRMWIKAIQQELGHSEDNFRITEWLAIVRKKIKIAPLYLTGINWGWIDEIIKQLRLKPFRGNSDGIYALLLMLIEEPDRDPTILRTSIEPIAREKNVSQLVDWLIDEYGSSATAFVRYFLTPNILILLKLVPNETAAFAARVNALAKCVQEFGFNEYLDHSLFHQEWKSLTTTLLLKNVNAGQFEIPWDNFIKDVTSNEKDLFETRNSLSQSEETLAILSNATVTTPHKYKNGRVVKYTLTNDHWPHALLLISIIDDFIQHPSFGLEVILSTRFRHDTLRREIVRAVSEIENSQIDGVSLSSQREIIENITGKVNQTINSWLKQRMQSQKEDNDEGLFNLTPSQKELRALVENTFDFSSFEDIADETVRWMKSKLDEQLNQARIVFENEFQERVLQIIDISHLELISRCEYRDNDILKVTAALRTAISRRVIELIQWFKSSTGNDRHPLTFFEVKYAADGLFESLDNSNSFQSYVNSAHEQAHKEITPEKVRLCFDLLSEVFANAHKSARGGVKKVRITPYHENEIKGFIFSNLASFDKVEFEEIKGEEYRSLDDAIFREGNSGLTKIAALAASLIERKTTLKIQKRKHAFHLKVPIWQEKS